MKRKLFMGILLIGVLSFAACGNKSSSDVGTQTNVQTEKEEVNEEKKDNQKIEVSMEALRNQEVSPVSDFEFEVALNGEGYEISKYLGKEEIVVIPEEYEGKKVVGIGGAAFNGNGELPNVKAIRLADSVEYIGRTAFMSNTNIEYVICGSGLKKIGENAFNGCSSLKEVELNEGLETLGAAAFTEFLFTEIYIPDSVTEIDSISFAMKPEGFTIKGKAGSVAEEYALENNYIFEAVE